MKKIFDDKSWSFLLASPSFGGLEFEESVVLLIEDNEDGSFGVLINRPMDKTLGEISADFEAGLLGEIEVFDGGPVSKDRVSIIAFEDGGDNNHDSFLFGITPEKAAEVLKRNPGSKVLAFVGYSGWEKGQLQREIEEGTWIVANVDTSVIFEKSPEDIWKTLILRECPQFEILEGPKGNIEGN